jgi:hypothetical protein
LQKKNWFTRHDTDRFLNNWKYNLEYGGTFTKLFMHVSSRNMFPTTRNLQIRVHGYRPHHLFGEIIAHAHCSVDEKKNIYIFHVYHIRIIAKKKLVHTTWNKTDSSIIIVRNVYISITVRENRIICCQIFCDLLLKSAFERIFNVMQLILVKIKWHIKWKYLIKKIHDSEFEAPKFDCNNK